MSAPVLLNLLNYLREKKDARLCRASYRFPPNELNKFIKYRSTNARFYL